MKYKYRRLLFRLYSILTAIFLKLSGKNTKKHNYHISFFKLVFTFRIKKYFLYTDKKLGIVIRYNPLKSSVGSRLYLQGSFEESELHVLSNLVKADDVVLDIGANIGIYSYFLSQKLPQGKILAFEPSKETYPLLLDNIKHLGNVFPFNIGLGEKTQTQTFFNYEDDAFSSIIQSPDRGKILSTSNIVCFKGDEILQQLDIDRLDLIKIDIEGFEKEALHGLSQTIDRFSPHILCELLSTDSVKERSADTFNFIRNKGYTMYAIDGYNQVERQELDSNYYNYICMKRP